MLLKAKRISRGFRVFRGAVDVSLYFKRPVLQFAISMTSHPSLCPCQKRLLLPFQFSLDFLINERMLSTLQLESKTGLIFGAVSKTCNSTPRLLQ